MSPTRLALLLALLPIAAPQSTNQPPIPAPALTESQSQSSDPSQAPPDSSQPVTTLHITSRAVVLDVVVTDGNGKPAHGLKPSDFTLTEDGVPQSLASFTEHVVASTADATAPMPPNTFAVQPAPAEDQTKTVIVLVANVAYVRNDIATFLKTAPANQPIALVRLDGQGMHLVQGLTTDRKVLLEAIASKRMLPPLGFAVHFVPLVGNPAQRLVRYVNSIPGRINLVCIGGNPFGEEAYLPNNFPDLSTVLQDLNGPSNVTRLSRVALYPVPLSETNIWANQALMETAKSAGGHVYFSGVRQALSEIVATGSDYYTISYVPTNPNWNGRYRRIKLNVAGFPQTSHPRTWSEEWSNLVGWTESQKSKVLYRPGYFARTLPTQAEEAVREIQGIRIPPDPHHQLLSYSPKGDPAGYGAATARPLNRAMEFGSMPLDQINFTVVASPSANVTTLKPGDPLPENSFLSQIFRQDAYRDVHIHYWIDPHNLTFSRDSSGNYNDALQFVVMIYRDDGFPANSIATAENVQVSADRIEETLTSGITFDQTIAVPLNGNPVPGNFFLHVGVCERSSNRVGTIEVPTEWIKLSPTQTASSK